MTAEEFYKPQNNNWKKYLGNNVNEITNLCRDINMKLSHIIEEIKDGFHTMDLGSDFRKYHSYEDEYYDDSNGGEDDREGPTYPEPRH